MYCTGMKDFAEKLRHRTLYSHVPMTEDGIALADYLSAHFSRFDCAGWITRIRSGSVSVNGNTVTAPEYRLRKHDRIDYALPDLPEPDADLSWRTLYEDAHLLVLEKSGNLCVHPTGPFYRHTLWHLAGSVYGDIKFVNRLDRETSGLIAAARSRSVAALMDNGKCPFRKEYLALVSGIFDRPVRAEGFLIRDTESAVRKKKIFITDHPIGAAYETADTELLPEKPGIRPGQSLVRAILHTGRQHQVRATLASLGFPLIGDKLYGPDERIFLKIREQRITPEDIALLGMERQALHAAVLEFPHPVTGETIRCESPCPFL